MYLSFRNADLNDLEFNWDIARCQVAYDGRINMPFRYYTVSDHMSMTRPYYGGLDADLKKDKYQNWAINQARSNSTCPPGLFQKCIFTCQIARHFST